MIGDNAESVRMERISNRGIMKRKTQQDGFTLIELLVVIAVIAILAAMLLPVLSAAQRRSIDLKCVSNCKEMLLGMTIYVTDANGRMISYIDPETGAHNLWIQRLESDYSVQQGVRCCPATIPPNPVSAWKEPPDAQTGGGMGQGVGTADYPWLWNGTMQFIGSYGLNGYCYADSYQYGFPPSAPANNSQQYYKRESNIMQPTQTPYFSDSVWVDGWPLETDIPAPDLYSGGDNVNGGLPLQCIARHGFKSASAAPRHVNVLQRLPGNVNIAFVDGHAGPEPLENLWSLYWHKDWVTPSPRPK